MTDTTNEEVLKLVEKAQSPQKFSITEFAKGRGYPEDSITAFLDTDSAYKLQKLGTDSESEEAEELRKAILASKVVFHMRGVNQAQIESITSMCDRKYPPKTSPLGQREDDPQWIIDWTTGLVAANLVSVENADGELDSREFTLEDATEMRHHLPKEVWALLVEKMQQLTLAGAYFKGLTDAGFLQKS
jgi:hypothetical protein